MREVDDLAEELTAGEVLPARRHRRQRRGRGVVGLGRGRRSCRSHAPSFPRSPTPWPLPPPTKDVCAGHPGAEEHQEDNASHVATRPEALGELAEGQGEPDPEEIEFAVLHVVFQ